MDLEKVTPQSQIWQLSLGFTNTSLLYTLVKTGVIEQMRNRSRSLSELAESLGLNSDVLYRVLRFAEAIGIVNFKNNLYSLTEIGSLLLKDVPGSIYLGILLFGSEVWQRCWQNLSYSLITGGITFDEVIGDPFFEYLDKHPKYGIPFNQWMTISTTVIADAIAKAYDFTPFKSVCDIGGGQGILLKNILTANPHLHGILYDQEKVVKDNVLAGFDNRVTIVTGNFFESVPAADVLMMKSVLHDWSDEKCRIILSNCRQTMKPSSRLLIIEIIIASPAHLIEVFFDLHMQLIAGGRERTEHEFSLLLQTAGMKLNRVIPTSSHLKIIEASLGTA